MNCKTFFFCFFALFLCMPQKAQARKGGVPIVINTGIDFDKLDYITKTKALKTRGLLRQYLKKTRVGFAYEEYGLFWINFWAQNGTFCLLVDDKFYETITEKEAAALLGKEVSRPFFYLLPPGLILLGLFFLFLLSVVWKEIRMEAQQKRYRRISIPQPAPLNRAY